MILLPRELMSIAAKAANIKMAQWAEDPNLSEEDWDKLYDLLSANLDRLQWLVQMTTEDLLNSKISDEDLPERLYFQVLKRDFGWDWSCEISPMTYWPSGLSYKTDDFFKEDK